MSPMLISSFRRGQSSAAPALRDSRDRGDEHESQTHLRRLSGLTTFHGRVVSETHPWGAPDSSTFALDDMDYPEGSTPPPSTQPRPPNWGARRVSPTPSDDSGDADVPEWSMDQYICFAYRGRSIWLRISILMDEQAFGIPTPHVSVRFMTRFSDDDPAIGRVGLIIERELQDGMRREILAAVRQAFRTQIPPNLDL